jgi:hypothetical protein
MLIDDIGVLTARIEKLRGLQRIASDAERFETRVTQIEQLTENLHSPTEAHQLLRSNGIQLSVPKPPAGLIAFADSLRQSVETDRASALSAMDGLSQRFKVPLERFCQRLTEMATQAWTEHVDRNTPPVNQEMLSVLARLRGFAESVSRVRGCIAQCQAHRTRVPRSSDDIRSLERALEALRNALGSLGSNELPRELLDFIRRAGLNGVPLDQLTDETLGWLREHDLLGQFVVKTA